MNRPTQHGRRRAKALLTAGLAVVLAWSAPEPVRELPGTAQRFVGYLWVLEGGGQKLSFWDRVMVSLVLAGGHPKRQSG